VRAVHFSGFFLFPNWALAYFFFFFFFEQL
jgi:hypothetical protein